MIFKAIPIVPRDRYIHPIHSKNDYKALWRICSLHLVKTTADKTKRERKDGRGFSLKKIQFIYCSISATGVPISVNCHISSNIDPSKKNPAITKVNVKCVPVFSMKNLFVISFVNELQNIGK